ncbi:MAG: alpha/beta fold hydrolase [Candidatus Acidiferrales bacterium]
MYGLQPFGLNTSAPSLLPIESIASFYIHQIKTREDRPYALLGYSFGGLVAVEMAQQLSKNGGFVPRVVLIDAEYPAGCKAAETLEERLRRYLYHLRRVAIGPNRLGHMVDRLKERWVRTAYRVASVAGTPVPNLSTSIVDRQKIAADLYRARPYRGRVYLFKAESEMEFFGGGPDLGWKGILSDLVIYLVPGDHGTINTGNNLTILAQQLASWLD